MNRNVKIGLIILLVLVVLVGFWKLSAPKKMNEEKKNLPPIPQPQTSETTPPVAEDETTGLDEDLLATTGTEDTDDSAIFSQEGLISDEPA